MPYVTCHMELPEHSYQGWTAVYRSESGLRFTSGLWPTEAEAIEKMTDLAESLDIHPTEAESEGQLTPEQLDEWVANT
jgi:hypothetical protein